jgi:hypothetical protein
VTARGSAFAKPALPQQIQAIAHPGASLWSGVTAADSRDFQAQTHLCGHAFAVQSRERLEIPGVRRGHEKNPGAENQRSEDAQEKIRE